MLPVGKTITAPWDDSCSDKTASEGTQGRCLPDLSDREEDLPICAIFGKQIGFAGPLIRQSTFRFRSNNYPGPKSSFLLAK